jgi:hypothetical protein
MKQYSIIMHNPKKIARAERVLIKKAAADGYNKHDGLSVTKRFCTERRSAIFEMKGWFSI